MLAGGFVSRFFQAQDAPGRVRQSQQGSMAERVGFEPTLPVKVNTLSKRAPSATRPSLHYEPLFATRSVAEQLPRLRSGFRRAAQTPRRRLNFSHSTISPEKAQVRRN